MKHTGMAPVHCLQKFNMHSSSENWQTLPKKPYQKAYKICLPVSFVYAPVCYNPYDNSFFFHWHIIAYFCLLHPWNAVLQETDPVIFDWEWHNLILFRVTLKTNDLSRRYSIRVFSCHWDQIIKDIATSCVTFYESDFKYNCLIKI